MNAHLPSTAVWTDGAIGAVLGFACLHPASMAIVGEGPMGEGAHAGGALSHLFSAMGLYFTLIGLGAGMLSGFFRGKVKRRSELLAVRTAELERALSENELLLRILSHDLVNSVGGAQTLVEMVLEEAHHELSDRPLEDLNIVNRSLCQARELIEFSRALIAIESGKREIALARHDLVKLVRETIAPFRHLAAQKGLLIELEATDGPLMCLVEPVTFRNAIVSNLLSNAIKFSYRAAKVHVALSRDGECAEIAITNSGPGIAKKDQARALSPNEASTTTGTAGESGTGFGVPLASRFARMMRGELRISSTLAEGSDVLHRTTVRVRLPLAP